MNPALMPMRVRERGAVDLMLVALAVAALLALGAGLWIGNAWRTGQNAIAQNKQLQAERAADRKAIADLKQAAQDLRQGAADRDIAYQQASNRMAAIASQLESDRESNRRFFNEQSRALAALAAARPDLRDLRLGDDVVRHVNRAQQGRSAKPDAPAAAPGRAGKPAPAVPAAAPAARRQGAVGPGADRRQREAVPGLQRPRRFAGEGDGRMAQHRVDLVVRSRTQDRRFGARRPLPGSEVKHSTSTVSPPATT